MSRIGQTNIIYSVSQAKEKFTIYFEHNGGRVSIRTGRFHKDGAKGFMTENEVNDATFAIVNNARKFRYVNLPEHHTVDMFQVFLIDAGTMLCFPTNSANSVIIDGIPHLESFDQVVQRLASEH